MLLKQLKEDRMTASFQICEDLAKCMINSVIIDKFDAQNLIGDRFNMSANDLRIQGILYPLASNAITYLFLWSKCYGESRNYHNRPNDLYTKWSITKIFTYSGPVVIVSQMWASIPYSLFNFPYEAYSTYTNQLHSYTHIGYLNNTNNPIGDLLEDNELYGKRFIDATNSHLREVPSWLGKVALIYYLIVGVKVLGSCYSKRRIGKRDALMLAIQTAALVYSIYLIVAANRIDFGPYLNTDLEGCKARYLTKPPA
ncbi:MAG: hypothetical protein ACK4HV_03480 [Parachlamydiaceae bacterium]